MNLNGAILINGQKQPERPAPPPLNIGVGAQGDLVILDLVLLDCDIRRAAMPPAGAMSIVMQLLAAVEQIVPGATVPFLKQTLAGIEQAQLHANSARESLGMG